MLKAQRLLVAYGLTMQDVADGPGDGQAGTVGGGQGRGDVADEAVGDPSGRLPWWHRLLAGIIADNFRCTAYLRRTRSGAGVAQGRAVRRAVVCFLGRATDVEVACEVFRFGLSAIARSARRFSGGLPAGALRHWARNDFVYGFLAGRKDKFAEQVERHRWALVLAQDDEVAARVREMRLGRAAPSRPGLGGDQAARQAGYRCGQEFGAEVRQGGEPPPRLVGE
jgi:hypothetical protein